MKTSVLIMALAFLLCAWVYLPTAKAACSGKYVSIEEACVESGDSVDRDGIIQVSEFVEECKQLGVLRSSKNVYAQPNQEDTSCRSPAMGWQCCELSGSGRK